MTDTTPNNGITDKLLSDLTNANSEAKRYRLAKKQAQQELDALKAEHAKLIKEVETLKSTPNQLQEELTKIKGELRTRDHKSHFTKLAQELKIRPDAVEDVWALSGYKADGDVPDLEKMKAAITEAVKSRPYVVGTTDTHTNGYTPGPGLSRASLNEGLVFTVRRSDAQNPEWLRMNSKKMAEATQNGSLKWLEG